MHKPNPHVAPSAQHETSEHLPRDKTVSSTQPPAERSSAALSTTIPAHHRLLGPSGPIGEGDSCIHHLDPLTYLPDSDDPTAPFHRLKSEVPWQKMYHQRGAVPRLVCAQGLLTLASKPVYRHPSDQSPPLTPFTPTADAIRTRVERLVGHPMNHCLLQLYRGGADYISEHSDKTLDVARGSSIVNVSLGARRSMRLRTKRDVGGPRTTQVVPLPHGSVFVLGPRTNMAWLHGINADRRREVERSEAERAFGGERISLTFRHIATFLDPEETVIWGLGAKGKTREVAGAVVNGDPGENTTMVRAFGWENQKSQFDWEAVYGDGFDVLHFSLEADGDGGGEGGKMGDEVAK